MTPEELNALIERGEGPTLEFKESLPSSLARSLTAFANARGGIILLGVRDDGTVAGVEDSNACAPASWTSPANATRRCRCGRSRWVKCWRST